MLETRAIVVDVRGKDLLVEARQSGGCGHCDSEKGCGSGKLSQMFCREPRQFLVSNDAGAKIGDEVQVTLPEGVLLRSAILVYLIPLVMLLVCGMVAASWATSNPERDGYALVGGVAGLVMGFLFSKKMAQRFQVKASAQPVILHKMDHS